MRKSRLILAVALAAAGLFVAPGSASGFQCRQILATSQPAAQGLASAGPNAAEIANLSGQSVESLRTLASDQTLWVDTCGRIFYVEEAAPPLEADVAFTAAFPYASTFLLHSKAGSNRTIYLDFNGYALSGTAWNANSGYSSINLSPFDQDGLPSSFSVAEQDVIQSVWQRVAEDYAPFDVDVTTEVPPASAIQRTDSLDTTFGTVLVVTNDTALYAKVCPSGCGGIAYLGVYDDVGSAHDYYQPALVFTQGVGRTNPKNIAEAASHEIGHNVGLSHDGTSTQGYYAGTNGWAPIMGVGYYQPLVQFSRGEYLDANQKQDDFAVMQSTGLPLRTDDVGNSLSSAAALGSSAVVNGVISTSTDVDVYSYVPTFSGSASFRVSVASVSPNLVPGIKIYSGSTLAYSSVPAPYVVNTDQMTSLDAVYSMSVVAGRTYYISVDGLGYSGSAIYNFSDYGSLGQYRLSAAPTLTIATTTLPAGQVGSPYSVGLTATGGIAPYVWSSISAPAGLFLSSSGSLSGTPQVAGSASMTARVTDSTGVTTTKSYSFAISKGTTLTALSSSALSLTLGGTVTLSVRVSYEGGTSSSGTATVFDGTVSIGTVTLISGTGSLTLSPGSGVHSYTATFNADSNWNSSTSVPVDVNVQVANVPSAPPQPSLIRAGSRSLTANWSEPANNGSSIRNYCLYLYSSGKNFKQLSKNCNLSSTTFAFTFTSLSLNTSYSVRVSAVNGIGEGSLSPYSAAILPVN